jgi:very-short-patch-repair endonuclease
LYPFGGRFPNHRSLGVSADLFNSAMAERELAALAMTQGGLVTHDQSRDHLSQKQIDSRLACGRLTIVRRGVYRYAGAPVAAWEPLRAALMTASPSAAASHCSAAEIWRLPGLITTEPELIVRWPSRVRMAGVRSHQSRTLPPHHLTRHLGLPVTTPARTLADLSTVVGPRRLGHLVDEGLRRHLLVLDDLREAYDVLECRGRRRLTVLQAVLESRIPGFHPAGSPAELDVRRILVAAGLGEPVPQHQVVVGSTVYLLDWAYPDDLVGIEYNGWEFHRSRSSFDGDAARSSALTAAGWRLLTVTSATAPRALADNIRRLRSAAA